ncbi:MAG TPA: hypothetical protein VGB52_07180 [Actinomycetota bacterium]
MPRRRIVVMLVVLLLALGGLLSGIPARADIPPCWNTYDIDHSVVRTWGCADVPIGPIGYIAVCTEHCNVYPICVYDPNRPGQEIGCGII